MVYHSVDPARPADHHTLIPNLLCANKQTLAEGLPLLYSNDLYFLDEEAVLWFVWDGNPRRGGSVPWPRRITLTRNVFVSGLTRSLFESLTVYGVNLESVMLHEPDPRFWVVQLANELWTEALAHGMHSLGENEEERRDAVDRVARLSTGTVKSFLTRYMPRVNEELVVSMSRKITRCSRICFVGKSRIPFEFTRHVVGY